MGGNKQEFIKKLEDDAFIE